MGVHIPPGYGLASWHMTLTGSASPMYVTCGFRHAVDNGGYIGGADAMAAGLLGESIAITRPWNPSWMAAEMTLVSVNVLINDLGSLEPGTAPANSVGVASPRAMTPPNCAILIRKNTARAGRKGRGRMYLPPMSFAETDVNSAGVIAAGSLSAIQPLFNGFVTGCASEGLPLFLLHQSPADTPNEITSMTVQSLMATQRRRLR